eukprot:TRINITY_DN6498_c0_g1_i3.p1 TRINITY_DN6498_c0_g1~~TRINITY_DN6498_c0_g1_i3.p1  ORF type:complete len:606 (+),score=176.25 TRINITY_DN6498_c0_g1_i3:95-1912(+)
MKTFSSVVALTALPAAGGAKAQTQPDAATAFGPSGCVSLSLSAAGSCVIDTNCDDRDLSDVDFSFYCVQPASQGGNAVPHSFGVGGFDSSETFDTEIKCDRCLAHAPVAATTQAPQPVAQTAAPQAAKHSPPPAPPVAEKPQNVEQAKPVDAATEADDDDEEPQAQPAAGAFLQQRTKGVKSATVASVVAVKGEPSKAVVADTPKSDNESAAEDDGPIRYGPNGCVSVERAESGHCVLATSCEDSDIKDYDFGFICVDREGVPVRHLFGQDSFDAVEVFDTNITCTSCLGLEDIPKDVHFRGEVEDLKQTVRTMEFFMKNLTKEISELQEKVSTTTRFPGAPAPAAAPAAVAEEDDLTEVDKAPIDTAPSAPSPAASAPATKALLAARSRLRGGSQHHALVHMAKGAAHHKHHKAHKVAVHERRQRLHRQHAHRRATMHHSRRPAVHDQRAALAMAQVANSQQDLPEDATEDFEVADAVDDAGASDSQSHGSDMDEDSANADGSAAEVEPTSLLAATGDSSEKGASQDTAAEDVADDSQVEGEVNKDEFADDKDSEAEEHEEGDDSAFEQAATALARIPAQDSFTDPREAEEVEDLETEEMSKTS